VWNLVRFDEPAIAQIIPGKIGAFRSQLLSGKRRFSNLSCPTYEKHFLSKILLGGGNDIASKMHTTAFY
jgi:hypothetical protein